MLSPKRKLAAAAAAVLAVFGAGGAIAATKHGSPGAKAFGGGLGRHGGELDAAASFLGLTPAALQTALAGGKTLAQVAADRSKSVTDLVAALKAAEVKELDAAVAAGRLTAAQEATIVATLTQRLTDLVNGAAFAGKGPHGGRFGHGDGLAAAASFLGLTPAALQTALAGGKTLAQVAADRSKSVTDLVAALKAAEVKELDAAVAAGRLTAAQEATIVGSLTQRLTDLVNGTRPAKGGAGRLGRVGHWRP